jgi:competence protein ComEA
MNNEKRPHFLQRVRGLAHAGSMLAMTVGISLALNALPATAAQRIDVNSATVEQLTDLPGIGEAKAEAIVAERSERPFSSVEDLERVRGIGPSLVADLRDRVTAGKTGGRGTAK